MFIKESNLLASIVRDSFYEFFKEFWQIVSQEELIPNWHIEYLCKELQEAALRVYRNQPRKHDYVINVPPGSTKSTIVSQMFPAWVWTFMPTAKFICASYAYNVAVKDSIQTRDIVESDLYQQCFPNLHLREDENTKGLFVNTKGGSRRSAGIGGSVTGYHAHFLLVDDPINPEEAFSESELKTVNRWMSSTLPTRKINKKVSVTVLVQQRLHQADPSGEILAKHEKSGKVKHICLPGELIYTTNKQGETTCNVKPAALAKFYVDNLLDPVRLSKEVLKELEIELQAYAYSAQILQDPVPLGGGMFQTERLLLETEAPMKRMVSLVRSWDKAGTKDGGAWSVGVLMGKDTKGDFWVLDVVRGQWASAQREEHIRKTADLDGTTVETILEVEGGSGGKESGENTVRNLAGHRVICYHPTGDKESRAYPFSSAVGGGIVHVLIRSWTRDFIEELRYFPNSRYKDQVDASSGAFNRLAKRKRVIGGM